jgi:hypothetical protein
MTLSRRATYVQQMCEATRWKREFPIAGNIKRSSHKKRPCAPDAAGLRKTVLA